MKSERTPAETIIEGLSSKSDKIRALAHAGYLRTEISKLLDIRYQHVRNVLVRSGITEGLQRNREPKQSKVLEWQIRTCFAEGCCGVFIFAWTDEWHRGGYDIEDWDFGLTTRDRKPKPALDTVSRAFESAPLRHSHAAALALQGVPLVHVQAQLGHANAATTSTYIAHVAPAETVEAVRRALS